jgi:SAM-dependent methyltransferase
MDIEQLISSQFTNIELKKENIFLYSVRKSIFEAVKKAVHLFKGDLLDIGCGLMPYKKIILKNVKVTKYTGMDMANAAYHGQLPPDLIWDAQTIPLENESIDTIIATEFLEHYHDTQSILKEISRVLKPNGIFFGTVPFVWNLHEVPYDEYRFTPYSLQKHFEKTGFSKIDISALGGANAAMAQMLGLWWCISPYFTGKKYLLTPVFWIYKWLLKNDKALKQFDGGENSLISGLSFIVYK